MKQPQTSRMRMTRGAHLEAHTFHAINKTFARPSVLLGAAIGGFLGSTSLYLLAKYAGFGYSVTTSLLWLCFGAIAGLVVELVASSVATKK